MSTNPRDMPRREGAFEREPARRVFASELRECRYQFKDGEDEKSPTFVLLPTGERSNRIFIVGTLTEKTRQGEQNMFYRGRVVDPTGTFFVMAGSYQPEAMQQLAKIEPPAVRCGHRKSLNLYQKDPASVTPCFRPGRINQCRGQGHPRPLGAGCGKADAGPGRCVQCGHGTGCHQGKGAVPEHRSGRVPESCVRCAGADQDVILFFFR